MEHKPESIMPRWGGRRYQLEAQPTPQAELWGTMTQVLRAAMVVAGSVPQGLRRQWLARPLLGKEKAGPSIPQRGRAGPDFS